LWKFNQFEAELDAHPLFFKVCHFFDEVEITKGTPHIHTLQCITSH